MLLLTLNCIWLLVVCVIIGKGHTLTWLHSQGIFPLDAFVRVSTDPTLRFVVNMISTTVASVDYYDMRCDTLTSVYSPKVDLISFFLSLHFDLTFS